MLPNEFSDGGEVDAALACTAAFATAVRDAVHRQAASGSSDSKLPGHTCDKLWGGMAFEDMGQGRSASLACVFQHICPDGGFQAACPAEEEGEPRSIVGFLLHTHAMGFLLMTKGNGGRHRTRKLA